MTWFKMDGTRSKLGLQDSVGHQVSRTARLFERRLEENLRPFGLTRIGWSILIAVHEEGRRNPSDIASFVGVDRTATSRALRTLEADGFITRSMGRMDRRTTEVAITELGQTQIRAAMPLCLESVTLFQDALSPSDVDTLKRLLDRLCQAETS